MAVSNEAVQDILISDGAYLVVDEVRIIDTGVYIRLEGGLLLILGADTLVFRRDGGGTIRWYVYVRAEKVSGWAVSRGCG